MGFRINRGIFQFNDGKEFVNKFKIADDGNMVEVNREGEPIAAYMRIGDKATDSDKLDGYHATNAGGGIPVLNANGYWYAPSWINVGNNGIFSSTNNAHFLPNRTSPHTAWEIIGSKGNWTGIYFRDSGNTLMANANDSGFYNKNAGWQMEWYNGNIYLSKQANGGGTLATVIDSTTIGSQSVDNADKLDGSHRYEVGNRDYTRTSFYVDGDENTYYPVLITPRGGYAFNRWSISRRYSWTAPWDPIGTGSHKGGLTFDFYWAADTAWGGNDKSIRIHQFSEQYTTMVGGIQLARTGGMIVWLRGGHAYYELQVDTAQATVDVKLDGWTDGSGTRFDPTTDVNQHRSSIWNNYPVRNGDDLYVNNEKVATESWVDAGFLRTGEKAADSNLLDGLDSSAFLRSNASDDMYGTLTIHSGGANTYGRIRGYGNDNHFIVIRGSVTTGQSTLTITGAHRTTFVEHADDSSEGWYFVSKASGNYTEKARIDGLGNIYSSNIITNQANIQSITSDGDIANDKGSYLHIGSWGKGRTDAGAVLVNTAYRSDILSYSRNFTIGNTTRGFNGSGNVSWTLAEIGAEAAGSAATVETTLNTRIDNDIRPAIETAQSTADGAVTTANSALTTAQTAETRANSAREAAVAALPKAGGTITNTITSTKNGTNIQMDGGASAEGIRVKADSASTYPVFLRAVNPSSGETSPWIYKESNTAWGIWHNNPLNSFDFTRSSNNLGIANNVGGQTNSVMIRLNNTDGSGIFKGSVTASYFYGKSSDSDKLDGYDWMQTGKSIRGSDIYTDGWLRNYNSKKGLYNQATGQHFYSDDDDYWNIAGGTVANGIRFRDEHDGTIRGYVYADSSNNVGLLDSGGSWGVRHSNDSGTYFYTDNTTLEFSVGRDLVTGSYGTVQTSTTRGGWGGYSINGQYVFMSNHSSVVGIYNDIDNEWMITFDRNAGADIRYNGATRLQTTNGGVSVTGTMTATSFAGDGAGLTGVPAAIPFTTVTGAATTCVSMNFDGRAMVFTMANGTSYSIDGARPNQ